MTGGAPAPHADALAPVRAELLRTARAEAEAVLAEARRNAEETEAAARAEAEAVLAEARRQGVQDGRGVAAGELARARRAARTAELAARGEAYADLLRLATERARERYGADPAISTRLTERARDLLGPGARITAHPNGGLLADVPGRLVDFGLPTLTRRALERLGPEVEQLWSPEADGGDSGG
ncbi:hypothetical protein [Kitasatospora sp. NPDC096204]|uniref:hypothetical protein n=1 Tax=Kitasatospora sp. NPDC096204 TaxID=3364094 RepID=UPI00382433FD